MRDVSISIKNILQSSSWLHVLCSDLLVSLLHICANVFTSLLPNANYVTYNDAIHTTLVRLIRSPHGFELHLNATNLAPRQPTDYNNPPRYGSIKSISQTNQQMPRKCKRWMREGTDLLVKELLKQLVQDNSLRNSMVTKAWSRKQQKILCECEQQAHDRPWQPGTE